MGFKAFVFTAVILLLISSEVAARGLAETSTEQKNTKAAAKTNEYGRYGGYGGYAPGGGSGGYSGNYCRYGCCSYGYGGCEGCCSYAGEAVKAAKAETEGKP